MNTETYYYTLYWIYGRREVIEGVSVEDAFTRAGYGNGAIAGLDFYVNGVCRDYYYNRDDRQWHRRRQLVYSLAKGDLAKTLYGQKLFTVDLVEREVFDQTELRAFAEHKLEQYSKILFYRESGNLVQLNLTEEARYATIGYVRTISVEHAEFCGVQDGQDECEFVSLGRTLFSPDDASKAFQFYLESIASGKDRPLDRSASLEVNEAMKTLEQLKQEQSQ